MTTKVFCFFPSVRIFLACGWAVLFLTGGPPAGAQTPAGGAVTLPEALRLAVDNNYSIRQARQRVEEQVGAVLEVRSATLPQAAVTGNFNQVDQGLLETFGGEQFGSDQSGGAAIQLSYQLYNGGANRAGVDRQQLLREAALFDLESVINAVLLDVRERFFAVLLARESVDVREEAVALLEEELATARSRFEAGAGSSFDVLRAEVAVANGRVPLIRARNALRLSLDALRQVIGLDEAGARDLQVEGELSFEPMQIDLPSALRSAADERPELKQLALVVEAREKNVDVQRAGRRPEVSVSAGYGIEKSRFSASWGDTIRGWTVGVQGNWPVFDGYATRGRLMQARAQQTQAELSLAEAELGIEVEVRQAHSSLAEATELVTASGRAVDQAEESLRLARARFDAGAATQLDVLQTQVALTEARTNRAQALHDYEVAVARLKKAIGTSETYFPREG